MPLSRAAFALSALLLSGSATAAPAPAPAAALTVERIVSRAPSLLGTAPAAPAWSPDGRLLGFTWNDRALPAREVWLVEREGTAPRRLTHATEGAQAADTVSEFAWQRDAKSLVYLAGGELYRIGAGGGAPEQLTHSGGDKEHLSISPDGLTLSFLRAGDLWLLPAAGGLEVQATHVGVKAPAAIALGTYYHPDVEVGGADWGEAQSYAWSPDGRTIAVHYVDRTGVRKYPIPYYLTGDPILNQLRRGAPGDVNELRTVGLLDVATHSLKLLELPNPSGCRVLGFAFAPDGALLIDRETDDSVERWILHTDVQGSAPRAIWHDRGEHRIYNEVSSTWSADGRSVLVTGDVDDRYRLYSIARTNRPDTFPAPLTPGPSDVEGAAIPAAGGAIYYVSTAPRPEERHVWRLPASGGAPAQVTSRPGMHAPFLSPDVKYMAVLQTDDVTPQELYLIDLASGRERRITHSPPPAFDSVSWVKARYVTFPGRTSGVALHARILEPPGLKAGERAPAIVGPVYTNRVRNRFDPRWGLLEQLLVQRGYIVAELDSRGSTGYGRAFREKFLFEWGSGDLDDYEDLAGYLKSLPHTDPARLGIFGSSYGGLVTVFALLKKPGLFAAGVAGAPATDARYFGSDDVAVARTPQAFPDVFARGRATLYAKDLRDHLMIIHGMADDVVPFQTSVLLAEALIKEGKDLDLVLVPAATHRWATRPDYAVYTFNKLLGHFDRWLRAGRRADPALAPSPPRD